MRPTTDRRDAARRVLMEEPTNLSLEQAEAILDDIVTALLDPEPSRTLGIYYARELCQEALGVHELAEMDAVTDVLYYLRDPDSITPYEN